MVIYNGADIRKYGATADGEQEQDHDEDASGPDDDIESSGDVPPPATPESNMDQDGALAECLYEVRDLVIQVPFLENMINWLQQFHNVTEYPDDMQQRRMQLLLDCTGQLVASVGSSLGKFLDKFEDN